MQESQAPPTGSRPRRWRPLASVVLCLAAVVLGGRVAASAVTVPGPPVQVAPGISVRPVSGWRVVREGTGVLLTRGSGSLSVLPTSDADPATLAGQYARQVLRPNAQGLTLSRGLRTFRLPSGLVGVSFAYQGTFRGQGREMPLQGEVTVVVGQRDGVVFDAWAQRRGGLPRWACQTSLFQLREPAFWVFMLLLVGTGLQAVGQQVSLREMSPSGWVLSWALLALYLVPMFLLVYLLDAYEREPLSLVFGALLWGAVAATSLAGLANHDWGAVVARLLGPDVAARWTAALTAPLVEETLKAVGVVLIYLIARSEINGLLDGFVYGAMVGLGFAVVENVFYFVGQFGGQPAGVLGGFFVRVLASGLYGHVLYTGLTGMGIAWFVTRTDQRLARRLLVAGGLCLLAVLAHFLWNSPLLNLLPTGDLSSLQQLVAIPLAAAVKGIPFLILVVLLVGLARRQERRWLEAAAAGELGGPALTAEELAVLEQPRRRWRARRAMRRRAGRRAAALLRRLQRQQLSLAMLRTRLGDDDDPDLLSQRQRIAQTREALGAAIAGSQAAA